MNAVSGWALGRSRAPDPGILCPGRIGRGVQAWHWDVADAAAALHLVEGVWRAALAGWVPAGRTRGVAPAGWAPRSTWWRSGVAVRWGGPRSARGRWSAGAGGHPRRVAHRADRWCVSAPAAGRLC